MDLLKTFWENCLFSGIMQEALDWGSEDLNSNSNSTSMWSLRIKNFKLKF